MLTGSPEPIAVDGSAVRVVFGRGSLAHAGELARDLGGRRVLLVTDPGIRAAGHVARAADILHDAGLAVAVFSDVAENPTTAHVDAGLRIAREHQADLLIGLGGGSAMDCAKGVNFLLTNGGRIHDYWGVGKATRDMLPMLAIPTTAGTGSEAQCAALISDADTHHKMACLDKKALPRIAILDADLTATCPRPVAAATGIDAIAHAIESAGSTKRNDTSRQLSRRAWDLLSGGFEGIIRNPEDPASRERMLLGAHLAGAAIENSMLGAAHACANPLTARYNIVHGVAIAVMLPHVIRYNTELNPAAYDDISSHGPALADRLAAMARSAGLATSLENCGIPEDALESLAEDAARQWTATFNPRPVTSADLLTIYRRAWPQHA